MKTKRAKRLVKIGLPSLLLLLAALLAASLSGLFGTPPADAPAVSNESAVSAASCSVGGSGRRIDPVDD